MNNALFRKKVWTETTRHSKPSGIIFKAVKPSFNHKLGMKLWPCDNHIQILRDSQGWEEQKGK